MTQYLVIKSVQLLVGRKTFRKDAIITAEDVGADKIKRYLAGGYIKPIGANVAPDPDDEDDDMEYLAPEEVTTLAREELRAYARKIGVSFARNISDANLATRVNEFIAVELSDEGDPDDEDDDETEGKKPGEDATGGEQQSLNNGGEA